MIYKGSSWQSELETSAMMVEYPRHRWLQANGQEAGVVPIITLAEWSQEFGDALLKTALARLTLLQTVTAARKELMSPAMPELESPADRGLKVLEASLRAAPSQARMQVLDADQLEQARRSRKQAQEAKFTEVRDGLIEHWVAEFAAPLLDSAGWAVALHETLLLARKELITPAMPELWGHTDQALLILEAGLSEAGRQMLPLARLEAQARPPLPEHELPASF